MNDFHATPVEWVDFLAQFESANLGHQLHQAKNNRDIDQAILMAQEFVNPWLWERPDNAENGFPVTISFKGL